MQILAESKLEQAKEINGDSALRSDPRWQLIERIAASSSLQKSARLRDLLRFLAEKSLNGEASELSEHHIGRAVFGKPEDYSVVEDSSVRVHIRQLRLRLHEYFDGEGRNENSIAEIPKGSYGVVFRTVEPAAKPVASNQRAFTANIWLRILPWGLAAIFLATTVAGILHHPTPPLPEQAPWPLSELFLQGNHPVQVVVADVNYGMAHLVNEQPLTLEQYLSPDYRSEQAFSDPHPTPREVRATKYLMGSLLTSYADLVVATSIVRMSGNSRDMLTVRAARELRPRDLEAGSTIFIGSPSSNPWVLYYEDKLNFQERQAIDDKGSKYFQNMHPAPGEQPTYRGLAFTGNAGEDYATISLVPSVTGPGNVLILQGLQQEGTEAAGLFLADATNRRALEQSLGVSASASQPIYFEALLRTRSVAGAPNTTTIIATRRIHP